MPQKGHQTNSANELIKIYAEQKVVAREILMSADKHDSPHSHLWLQLIYPRKGMLRTRAQNKQYFIPSNRAALVPKNLIHESWAITPVQFIGVYFPDYQLDQTINKVKIIHVSPLLSQLIYQVYQIFTNNRFNDIKNKRLLKVFFDQLVEQQEVKLEVNLPQDKRLQKITDSLLKNPASDVSLTYWEKVVGASSKTISRLFENQTGLNYRLWRQRVRLISSLPLIEQGTPIQTVALDVGYKSASAFISCFKKEFGLTPLQYFLNSN